MASDPQKVDEILDCLADLAARKDEVRVGHVVSEFGSRSYGPVLVVPAMLELSPLGALPGVPSFLAVTVAIISVQMLVDRDHVWLPGFIANRGVKAHKLGEAAKKMRGAARYLDRLFHGRLEWLTHKPFTQLAALVILVLCASIPPLEFVPLAAAAPMAAVLAFGVALLVRDGALMLAALAISLAALGLGYDFWDGGVNDTEATDGVVTDQTIDEAGRTVEETGAALSDAADQAAQSTARIVDEVAAD